MARKFYALFCEERERDDELQKFGERFLLFQLGKFVAIAVSQLTFLRGMTHWTLNSIFMQEN